MAAPGRTLEELFADAIGPALEPLRAELARLRQEVAALRSEKDEAPVTMAEAARRLGVSLRTVERQVARGEIESVKVGRARRVRLPPRDG